MQEFKTDSFESDVLKSDIPTIVDFWAPWCGPCKTLGPIFEELATENIDKAFQFGKVNVDEQPDLATKYEVLSIPTMIIFKNGQEVDRIIGLQSKEDLQEKIHEFLS